MTKNNRSLRCIHTDGISVSLLFDLKDVPARPVKHAVVGAKRKREVKPTHGAEVCRVNAAWERATTTAPAVPKGWVVALDVNKNKVFAAVAPPRGAPVTGRNAEKNISSPTSSGRSGAAYRMLAKTCKKWKALAKTRDNNDIAAMESSMTVPKVSSVTGQTARVTSLAKVLHTLLNFYTQKVRR